VGASLYWALMALFRTLPPDLGEGSNDLAIYRRAGEALLQGDLPYRDFFIEYPPGSLPAFVPPALLTDDSSSYVDLFASQMALALVAALGLTALAARRSEARPGAWLLPAATFAGGAVMLYPVAVTRYDALVALTLAAASLCAVLGGRYVYLAYCALGFGTAAKLVPALATVPLALAHRGARGNAALLRGYAFFFAVLGLFFVPALLAGGGRFMESFSYHAERGLQVESLAASILMGLGWVEGITFRYGAFEVEGRGVGLASSLSLPLTLALLAATTLVAYREYRAGRAGYGQFPRYAAALVLAFMVCSKVLSPQYLVWLLPLVPLAALGMTRFSGSAGLGVSILFLAACWTTTQVYPVYYDSLLQLRSPGPELLLLRNALLVLLWAALLISPSRPPEKAPV
jgi:hypothetical protein